MCGEFEITEDEEVSAKIVNKWPEEFQKCFNKLSAEDRAYKVIRSYMSLDDPSDDMREKFAGWLLDSRNAEAKDKAMEQIFCERPDTMDEILPAVAHNK